jgi:nitrate/TMAO reductase-like tetraheme cytochrome c subunit
VGIPLLSALVRTRRRKILTISGLVAFPFFTFGSVELTSGPGFCDSCHEIKPAVASWRTSQHAPKDGKHRADCRDCHVPSWRNPAAVVWIKLKHGAKDVYHHFASAERRKEPDFYFRLKAITLEDVDDRTCLSCHEDMRGVKDVIKTEDGEVVRGLHQSAEARKVRCTVCHKNTGHGPFD